MQKIDNILTIAQDYQIIFCDVWGVIHNGVVAFAEALRALKALKQQGKKIVFITNSPRLASKVEQQLYQLGINQDCYDYIVTSGDATRFLVQSAPKKLFYIGVDNALSIVDGLDVEFTELSEAQAVLCTGLFAHFSNDLSNYDEILLQAKARNLPFICANPDIEVFYGDKLLYCAGALAECYMKMGGECLIAGKPHSSIYTLALEKLGLIKESDKLDKKPILAIGDGLLTDIKGAENFGINSVFITNGVNRTNYTDNEEADGAKLQLYLQQQGILPTFYMDRLQ